VVAWWEKLNITPMEIARKLWEQSHPKLSEPAEENVTPDADHKR
jgi:hypothetical protein